MTTTFNFDPFIPVAEATSEADKVIYRISHDLRASIRALQELPRWVTEDLDKAAIRLPPASERHLELIADHACRLDLMLTGLLDYSRIGRMQAIAPVKPARICADVIADLGVQEVAALTVSIDRGSVQMGDADLARVFSILLTNALRFNTAPAPRIDIVGGPIDERTWRICVRDNGPGIPEGKREFVQRPMAKLVPRDVDPGAGMGLAILKKIASHYGGGVSIGAPRSGTGTVVTVTLAVN